VLKIARPQPARCPPSRMEVWLSFPPIDEVAGSLKTLSYGFVRRRSPQVDTAQAGRLDLSPLSFVDDTEELLFALGASNNLRSPTL